MLWPRPTSRSGPNVLFKPLTLHPDLIPIMKRIQTILLRVSNLALLTLLVVGLSACGDANVAGTEPPQDLDLVQQAAESDFATLTAAIEAAQLTATLRADGPFTVFAPTNEAFAKLPESALRTLLHPDNEKQLTELLTAHVVQGRVYANDVFSLSSAKSLEGTDLSFKQEGDALYVNGARITATDIEASNGVIHVVDTVLLPEWFDRWFSAADLGIDPEAYDER